MALPININDLVNGQSIEWERLEFKKGWNPEEVVHTVCAFANDCNNWGGGYIIIGIAESNGKSVLPPVGLPPESLDKIQGEILKLAYQLSPNYFPLVQPYVLDQKHILVIWCPAGDYRPYKAPVTQGKNSNQEAYIRFGSRTIIAKDENLRRLQELTARVPFDDRINGKATIDALDLGLIQAFLQEIKSDLYEESKQISFADLCQRMRIVNGPKESLRPLNVGLLFFCNKPEDFLNRSWIEVVNHTNTSDEKFTEKYFKGPIHYQLRSVLDYLKNNILEERVVKVLGQAEANRYFNYPYTALEEALSNAVYHKSYEMAKPIEVQIWFDRIEILSFPGPVPPVDAQILKQNERIVARDYRNRRIGDLLKELHLTEGRGTGFPAIRKAMKANNSPMPVFETDAQSTFFLTILFAKAQVLPIENQVGFQNLEELGYFLEAKSNQASNQANDQASDQANANDNAGLGVSESPFFWSSDQASNQVRNQANQIILDELHDKVKLILDFLDVPKKRAEILEHIELSNQTKNKVKYLDPLVKLGWIALTIPNKPTHQDQKYQLRPKGKMLLKILNQPIRY